MAALLSIRETGVQDHAKVLALYPLMFPDEDLSAVVSELLEMEGQVLSLVSCQGEEPAAHVVFTPFADEGKGPVGALLGPLGVHPAQQGRGIGTALVEDGLKRLKAAGIRQVFVLGDPNYYGRFGFAPERHAMPPYEIPDAWRDAWQSLLLAGQTRMAPGSCALPDPWMKPELWAP